MAEAESETRRAPRDQARALLNGSETPKAISASPRQLPSNPRGTRTLSIPAFTLMGPCKRPVRNGDAGAVVLGQSFGLPAQPAVSE